MRLSADQELCCGAAQCVLAAPEVFDQGEDGLVLLLDPAPAAAFHRAVREAVDACPSGAIRLHEE